MADDDLVSRLTALLAGAATDPVALAVRLEDAAQKLLAVAARLRGGGRSADPGGFGDRVVTRVVARDGSVRNGPGTGGMT